MSFLPWLSAPLGFFSASEITTVIDQFPIIIRKNIVKSILESLSTDQSDCNQILATENAQSFNCVAEVLIDGLKLPLSQFSVINGVAQTMCSFILQNPGAPEAPKLVLGLTHIFVMRDFSPEFIAVTSKIVVDGILCEFSQLANQVISTFETVITSPLCPPQTRSITFQAMLGVADFTIAILSTLARSIPLSKLRYTSLHTSVQSNVNTKNDSEYQPDDYESFHEILIHRFVSMAPLDFVQYVHLEPSGQNLQRFLRFYSGNLVVLQFLINCLNSVSLEDFYQFCHLFSIWLQERSSAHFSRVIDEINSCHVRGAGRALFVRDTSRRTIEHISLRGTDKYGKPSPRNYESMSAGEVSRIAYPSSHAQDRYPSSSPDGCMDSRRSSFPFRVPHSSLGNAAFVCSVNPLKVISKHYSLHNTRATAFFTEEPAKQIVPVQSGTKVNPLAAASARGGSLHDAGSRASQHHPRRAPSNTDSSGTAELPQPSAAYRNHFVISLQFHKSNCWTYLSMAITRALCDHLFSLFLQLNTQMMNTHVSEQSVLRWKELLNIFYKQESYSPLSLYLLSTVLFRLSSALDVKLFTKLFGACTLRLLETYCSIDLRRRHYVKLYSNACAITLLLATNILMQVPSQKFAAAVNLHCARLNQRNLSPVFHHALLISQGLLCKIQSTQRFFGQPIVYFLSIIHILCNAKESLASNIYHHALQCVMRYKPTSVFSREMPIGSIHLVEGLSNCLSLDNLTSLFVSGTQAALVGMFTFLRDMMQALTEPEYFRLMIWIKRFHHAFYLLLQNVFLLPMRCQYIWRKAKTFDGPTLGRLWCDIHVLITKRVGEMHVIYYSALETAVESEAQHTSIHDRLKGGERDVGRSITKVTRRRSSELRSSAGRGTHILADSQDDYLGAQHTIRDAIIASRLKSDSVVAMRPTGTEKTVLSTDDSRNAGLKGKRHTTAFSAGQLMKTHYQKSFSERISHCHVLIGGNLASREIASASMPLSTAGVGSTSQTSFPNINDIIVIPLQFIRILELQLQNYLMTLLMIEQDTRSDTSWVGIKKHNSISEEPEYTMFFAVAEVYIHYVNLYRHVYCSDFLALIRGLRRHEPHKRAVPAASCLDHYDIRHYMHRRARSESSESSESSDSLFALGNELYRSTAQHRRSIGSVAMDPSLNARALLSEHADSTNPGCCSSEIATDRLFILSFAYARSNIIFGSSTFHTARRQDEPTTLINGKLLFRSIKYCRQCIRESEEVKSDNASLLTDIYSRLLEILQTGFLYSDYETIDDDSIPLQTILDHTISEAIQSFESLNSTSDSDSLVMHASQGDIVHRPIDPGGATSVGHQMARRMSSSSYDHGIDETKQLSAGDQADTCDSALGTSIETVSVQDKRANVASNAVPTSITHNEARGANATGQYPSLIERPPIPAKHTGPLYTVETLASLENKIGGSDKLSLDAQVPELNLSYVQNSELSFSGVQMAPDFKGSLTGSVCKTSSLSYDLVRADSEGATEGSPARLTLALRSSNAADDQTSLSLTSRFYVRSSDTFQSSLGFSNMDTLEVSARCSAEGFSRENSSAPSIAPDISGAADSEQRKINTEGKDANTNAVDTIKPIGGSALSRSVPQVCSANTFIEENVLASAPSGANQLAGYPKANDIASLDVKSYSVASSIDTLQATDATKSSSVQVTVNTTSAETAFRLLVSPRRKLRQYRSLPCAIMNPPYSPVLTTGIRRLSKLGSLIDHKSSSRVVIPQIFDTLERIVQNYRITSSSELDIACTEDSTNVLTAYERYFIHRMQHLVIMLDELFSFVLRSSMPLLRSSIITEPTSLSIGPTSSHLTTVGSSDIQGNESAFRLIKTIDRNEDDSLAATSSPYNTQRCKALLRCFEDTLMIPPVIASTLGAPEKKSTHMRRIDDLFFDHQLITVGPCLQLSYCHMENCAFVYSTVSTPMRGPESYFSSVFSEPIWQRLLALSEPVPVPPPGAMSLPLASVGGISYSSFRGLAKEPSFVQRGISGSVSFSPSSALRIIHTTEDIDHAMSQQDRGQRTSSGHGTPKRASVKTASPTSDHKKLRMACSERIERIDNFFDKIKPTSITIRAKRISTPHISSGSRFAETLATAMHYTVFYVAGDMMLSAGKQSTHASLPVERLINAPQQDLCNDDSFCSYSLADNVISGLSSDVHRTIQAKLLHNLQPLEVIGTPRCIVDAGSSVSSQSDCERSRTETHSRHSAMKVVSPSSPPTCITSLQGDRFIDPYWAATEPDVGTLSGSTKNVADRLNESMSMERSTLKVSVHLATPTSTELSDNENFTIDSSSDIAEAGVILTTDTAIHNFGTIAEEKSNDIPKAERHNDRSGDGRAASLGPALPLPSQAEMAKDRLHRKSSRRRHSYSSRTSPCSPHSEPQNPFTYRHVQTKKARRSMSLDHPRCTRLVSGKQHLDVVTGPYRRGLARKARGSTPSPRDRASGYVCSSCLQRINMHDVFTRIAIEQDLCFGRHLGDSVTRFFIPQMTWLQEAFLSYQNLFYTLEQNYANTLVAKSTTATRRLMYGMQNRKALATTHSRTQPMTGSMMPPMAMEDSTDQVRLATCGTPVSANSSNNHIVKLMRTRSSGGYDDNVRAPGATRPSESIEFIRSLLIREPQDCASAMKATDVTENAPNGNADDQEVVSIEHKDCGRVHDYNKMQGLRFLCALQGPLKLLFSTRGIDIIG